MMDIEEKRIKHLEMIQGVINRLAGNSFAIKGWSITLVSALIAIAVDKSDGKFIFIALLPAAIFWILDGYFLWQERLFRELHNAVRLGQKDKAEDNFTMDTSLYLDKVPNWFATTFYITKKKPNTLLYFHGIVVLCILIATKLIG
ncbi:MAG: hypothetical protein PHU71_06850 [Candidatus Gracilibacteria bacterium]|nr:hypothetical protein [Candidatus Gracilibacteria bacterium]